MKKRLSLGLLLMICIFMFSGCSSKSDQSKETKEGVKEMTKVEGGTFTYPIPTDVNTLNRHYEIYKEGHIMMRPLYDVLYYIDKDETRYYLAESYTLSDDKLKLTVKLKDNLKWHDGEQITADDFIYTLKVAADPKSGSGYISSTKIEDESVTFEKVDDLTVDINLPKVSASYEAILGNLVLLPEHVFNGETDIKTSEKNLLGIGSGPYKVKEWKKGEALVLERFDDYYRGKPNLDSVVFKIMPNDSAQEIALKNDEISIKELNDDQSIDKFKSDKDFELYSFPEGRVNHMAMNRWSPVFNDIEAQKAVVAALNVEEIVSGAYGSEDVAQVANSIFGPKTYYRDNNLQPYKQDIEKAKKIISETQLDKKTIKLIYNTNRLNQKETALIIQQQLKDVGLNVEITGYESQGFFAKCFSQDTDFDMYLNGYPSAGDPNGLTFMFSGVNTNISGKARELWKEGDLETDPSKREKIYTELQKQAQIDMTFYPIAYPNFSLVANKNYKGIDAIEVIPVFEDYLKIYMVK